MTIQYAPLDSSGYINYYNAGMDLTSGTSRTGVSVTYRTDNTLSAYTTVPIGTASTDEVDTIDAVAGTLYAYRNAWAATTHCNFNYELTSQYSTPSTYYVNDYYHITNRQYDDNLYLNYQTPPVVLKRQKLKNNLIIIVKSRACPLNNVPNNEWVAMQTLREMITETDFRKYLKYGFILVKGSSGKVYQIFQSKSHIKVYSKGVLIEEICVRIKDSKIPNTDSVIAFKTILEANEESLTALGNRYQKRAA